MVDQDASDLHITVGVPPEFRIGGKMVKVKMDPLPRLTPKSFAIRCSPMRRSPNSRAASKSTSRSASRTSPASGVILFYQRGSVAGVFRRIPFNIPDFDTLKLPQVLKKIIRRPNGLILVTGPTGSGKSTSLASMLDLLNREEFGHLMTIEDPIEFVHPHKNCIVNQREVGADTKSFQSALKRVLRQDPDFILVGELRDVETIEMALDHGRDGPLGFRDLAHEQRDSIH